MITVHSTDGRHFLGLREGRAGGYEIVYEGGRNQQRLVWQLKSKHIDTDRVGRQLQDAIRTADVLNTLYSGLRSAEIDFEIDYG
jgi:hypothetical protein